MKVTNLNASPISYAKNQKSNSKVLGNVQADKTEFTKNIDLYNKALGAQGAAMVSFSAIDKSDTTSPKMILNSIISESTEVYNNFSYHLPEYHSNTKSTVEPLMEKGKQFYVDYCQNLEDGETLKGTNFEASKSDGIVTLKAGDTEYTFSKNEPCENFSVKQNSDDGTYNFFDISSDGIKVIDRVRTDNDGNLNADSVSLMTRNLQLLSFAEDVKLSLVDDIEEGDKLSGQAAESLFLSAINFLNGNDYGENIEDVIDFSLNTSGLCIFDDSGKIDSISYDFSIDTNKNITATKVFVYSDEGKLLTYSKDFDANSESTTETVSLQKDSSGGYDLKFETSGPPYNNGSPDEITCRKLYSFDVMEIFL